MPVGAAERQLSAGEKPRDAERIYPLVALLKHDFHWAPSILKLRLELARLLLLLLLLRLVQPDIAAKLKLKAH